MKIRKAIYPGSFDPITNGHMDIAERALRLFDEIIIAIAQNSRKTSTFTLKQRILMAQDALAHVNGNERIKVMGLEGLLVDFARKEKACAIVRGLRAVSDFQFEFELALTNRKLKPEIDTIFLMPKENCVYLSSHIVKEIARLGGDVEAFVPRSVAKVLQKKYKSEN